MIKKNYFEPLILGIQLFASLCFVKKTDILIYAAVIAVSVFYCLFKFIKSGKFDGKYLTVFLWMFFFNLILSIYALNSKYTYYAKFIGYSPAFNFLTVLSMSAIIYLIYCNYSNLNEFMYKSSSVSIWLIFIYLMVFDFKSVIGMLTAMNTDFRLGGNKINPNSIAITVGICSFFVILNLFISKNKTTANIMTFVISVGLILLSGSKKGFLILIFTLLGFYMIFVSGSNKIKNLPIFICVIALMVYLIFFVDFFYNIMGIRILKALGTIGIGNATVVGKDVSTKERSEMIHKALLLFREKPLFGNGWNYFAANAGFGMYSHNNYTELLVSMGVFGIVCYYWVYALLIFKNLSRFNNKQSKVNLILIIMLLVVIDFASVQAYGSVIDCFVLAYVSISVYQKEKIVIFKGNRKIEIQDKIIEV